MTLPDTKEKNSFDGIANKFDNNIYGTTKGQLRHQILVHCLQDILNQAPMKVLDAGGGTGMMALVFANHGHDVTIVDVSSDALMVAKTRLKDFPNTKFIKADIDSISERFDCIICHAVLEWLDEPLAYIDKLTSLLSAKGYLSLSFFNYHAKVFSNLLYTNFDYVKRGMPIKNTVRLNPHNAQKPLQIIAHIEQQNQLSILATRGVRCIHDYVLDKNRIEDEYKMLFEMEIEYGAQEPYKWLGKYFHIMLQARS